MADAEALAREVIDALAELSGRHPGHRALHTKGVLCAGTFTPTPQAAALSRAAHFAGPEVRAHVRFSNASGSPTSLDYDALESQGMAVKFYLPDGKTTDISSVTAPVFVARTPEDFLAFVQARRPDPATGEPDFDRVGAYLAEHPEAVPAVTAVMSAPPPASYVRLTYHALHAFRFVAADGSTRHARYHWLPDEGDAVLTMEEATPLGADYLTAELGERLARGAAGFTLTAQVAQEGDPLDDPTAAWPDDREIVELGHLDVTGLAHDREREGDILVFDPTRVTDGIELTDDPILLFRPAAYSVSVELRSQP